MVFMGTIKPSKDQALVSRDSKVNSKDKKKANKPLDKKGDKSKSQEESSNSNKNNFQKKKDKSEGGKSTYYGKGFHPEISCMKKKIDVLSQLLEKKNISLTGGTSKKEGGSSFKDQERGHSLVASTIGSP